MMTVVTPTENLKRIYVGNRYMKETLNGATKEYTFIGGDAYSAPAVIEKIGSNKTPYFLLRDHLGSITHVVDNSGTPIEYSFDAWGRQRNPANWENYPVNSEPTLFMGRGFTGHEHLPWFNLINMNGRLYDPLVGRFLSPDNYVSSPDFTQGYNRYAYCLNNPLLYTDPDGDNPLLIAAIIISGTMGAGQAMMNSTETSFGGILGDMALGYLKGAGRALLSAGAASAIGNIFEGIGGVGHELLRAGAHGLASGGIDALFGGDFVGGAAEGFAGSLGASAFGDLGLGSLGHGISGAASGALGSWAAGSDPWEGAISGGIIRDCLNLENN